MYTIISMTVVTSLETVSCVGDIRKGIAVVNKKKETLNNAIFFKYIYI